MGCGSSKSSVAVIDNNNQLTPKEKTETLKETQSLDHFKVNFSITNLKKKDDNESRPQSSSSSIDSLGDSNNKKNKINTSRQSLRNNEIKKPSTANSSKSGDSGVFDDGERLSSAKSHKSVSSKPPSGSKSSARQRLLRIEDQVLEQNKDGFSNTELNMVERPKTRFGNVAFDLMVDAPKTGNMKKRPDSLPALERKKKRSKKIKTKEEIDKKMIEVEERRKLQELEKQMKAKQFQHLAIHTTVQPFTCEAQKADENN